MREGHIVQQASVGAYAHPCLPQALVEKGLDHTEGTDMEGTLADPVKIRQWQVRQPRGSRTATFFFFFISIIPMPHRVGQKQKSVQHQ